jgi:hypothetical protein
MAKMTEQEMQELAEKLVEMPVNKARGYTRRLDDDAVLKLMRVGVGQEILTRYQLPNKGVVVTLVELAKSRELGDELNRIKIEPEFVEARVEALK